MADEHNRTTGLTDTTQTGTLDADRHDANRDPLTGESGAHPVGTGVGAASGGTIGAVIGGAVGGPVGAIIGAAVGGLTGGFAGKGIAESVNPTEEDSFWSDAYKDRPYAQNRDYEQLRPAYRHGWESRTRYADKSWNDVEPNLESDWNERHSSTTGLAWDDAKHASRDAWNRVEDRHRFNTEEDTFWRETYASRPYAQGRNYDDLSPAYRYGYESGGTFGRQGSWNDHESNLERGWEKAKGNSKLAWHEAKDAVKDSWHRATNRWDDNEDNYWRSNYSSRPYASGRSYDDVKPAYRYGFDSANYYQGRRFEDVESELGSRWDTHAGGRSKWSEVKDAVRDAWDRATTKMGQDTTGTYNLSGRGEGPTAAGPTGGFSGSHGVVPTGGVTTGAGMSGAGASGVTQDASGMGSVGATGSTGGFSGTTGGTFTGTPGASGQSGVTIGQTGGTLGTGTSTGYSSTGTTGTTAHSGQAGSGFSGSAGNAAPGERGLGVDTSGLVGGATEGTHNVDDPNHPNRKDKI
ncbi:MAG TPA: hypothetical protein VJ885_07190 [Thermoanaerobaculia bacterium]|nr:hypothetical protein [Thermoanaerobaculia bacterium]